LRPFAFHDIKIRIEEASMKSDEAAATFREGFNCAQGVLLPFAEERGSSREACALVASPFGAGMGRSQETCGAVTGALMAIGLKYGFSRSDDQGARDAVLRETKKLLAAFRGEFGTVKCRELLGSDIDLNTDEGQRLHTERNQRELICEKCVRFAASVVESL
jgi:C_GCAxxG_C_C family probable redox protein